MKTQYYPEDDVLTIDLTDGPAAGGGEEVKEGILLFYDDRDRLVSIEIEAASKRVDLSHFNAMHPDIAEEDKGVQELLTISQLAERWSIDSRTLRKTIQSMAKAGVEVGNRMGSTNPILLTESDVAHINEWRSAHRPGRPAKTELQER